jgi:transposase
MSERSAYPSGLSDARWALIAPRLTAWRQTRTDAGVGGRTATHELREIFNAILYVNRPRHPLALPAPSQWCPW